MLHYDLPPLSNRAINALNRLRAKIESYQGQERYAKARELFSRKSPQSVFNEIRDVLAQNAPSKNSCYYCERDRFRDIDHVRPIKIFPLSCFDWNNYVYSCTICNQDQKSDICGTLDENGQVILLRAEFNQDNSPIVFSLIDIRNENPMDFIFLDLVSGLFIPHPSTDSIGRIRADFTINLFKLNDGDLPRRRKAALKEAISLAESFRHARSSGDVDGVERILNEIDLLPFPTVLSEIYRQHTLHDCLRELFSYFLSARDD